MWVSTKPCYNLFVPAILVAMDKLNTYSRLSTESDTHIMAMGMVFFFSYVHHLLTIQPSVCSELTVDDSESLGGLNRVYADSRERGTKVRDDQGG